MARPQWACRWWRGDARPHRLPRPARWRRHEGDTFFGLDQSELRITGQGYIQLDATNHVHRFYTDEEIMLQAVSRVGRRSGADDITIFHGLWSHQPHTDPGGATSSSACASPLRHEGVHYDRFWLEAYENDQDPGDPHRGLFTRTGRAAGAPGGPGVHALQPRAGAGGTELLLALEVAPDHGSIVQELMVGLPLARPNSTRDVTGGGSQ
jgi:hypothetical protein